MPMPLPSIVDHPAVVIITTAATLIGVAASLWASLTYIRKRWIGPLFRSFAYILDAASMVPAIREQLFSNGGATLRDAVDKANVRLAIMDAHRAALMQEHPTGIFMTDKTGKNVWVNHAYLALLGTSESHVLGFGWKNFVVVNERTEYVRAWEEAVKEHREFSYTVRIHRAGGMEAEFRVRAYPIPDDGYVGFMELATADSHS